MNVWRVLMVMAGFIVFVGCAVPPAPSDPDFVVADVFATPGKSLATLEPSPSVPPSPTVINVGPPTTAPTLQLPTVVVLQPGSPLQPAAPTGGLLITPIVRTPTPAAPTCVADPPLPFAAIWLNIPQAAAMLQCPVSGPDAVVGVWQVFERGVMFWRESDRSIFVISDSAIRQGKATDSWWRFVDTWTDAEPDSDPSLSAPPGLRQPVRGFGKVWRANGFIRESVGWAAGDETRIDSLWMIFDKGWMIAGPNGAPIYVMIPLDSPPYSVGLHLAPAQ